MSTITMALAHKTATQENNTSTALVLEHYRHVRSIAYRIHKRLPLVVDVNDLISAGSVGLILAADRYDDTKSVSFLNFARFRIRGAMIDFLRGQDWVPRSIRRKGGHLARAKKAFFDNRGRAPTSLEMANILNITVSEYHHLVFDAQFLAVISLDAPIGDDNPTPIVEQLVKEQGSVDVHIEWHESLEEIYGAIQFLPDKERKVLTMSLQGVSLKKAGKVLNVSESRACQLYALGTKRLRYRFRNHVRPALP